MGELRGYATGGHVVWALLVVLTACGTGRRAGPELATDPTQTAARLLDPTMVYRNMGFLTHARQPAFVGTAQFMAGPNPDSTLVVTAISLANSAFSFRRGHEMFEARYRVETVFQQEGRVVRRTGSQETVRVATFEETTRSDESVLFQQFVIAPPGEYELTISVRDEYSGTLGRARRDVTIPRFAGPALSSMVAVYDGTPRESRDSLPRLLLNPRATARYGPDSLVFHIELYDLPEGTDLAVTVLGELGGDLWSGVVPAVGDRKLQTAVLVLPSEELPLGQLSLVARAPGVDSVNAVALVSVSDMWAITSFDEVLALLRYFGHERQLDSIRRADPADRPAMWRAFWEATDPNPSTPQHEGLEEYLRRIQVANARFREPGETGWLTDRGEVYISLGEPDEVFDRTTDLRDQRRVIRWVYHRLGVVLDFVDEIGFGRYRMTMASRSEFYQAVARKRSAE